MDYIGKKMSSSFLASVTISLILGQASLLLKPLVAGHFLGGDAVAVLTLANPIIEFCYSIVVLLSFGASYIVTECISVNNYEKVNKIFTVAAISTTLAVVAIALSLFLSRETISVFLCGNRTNLVDMMEQYLTALSWSCIPLGIFNLINFHFIAEGNTRFSIHSNFFMSFVDLTLSILFLELFDSGIIGLSVSFATSLTFGVMFCMVLMLSGSALRIVSTKSVFFQYFRENIKKGFPLLMDNSLYFIFILFCNMIVVENIGDIGVIVWGIVGSFIYLSVTLMDISSQSSNTLGFEMIALKDYRGLLQMLKYHRKFVLLSVMCVLVIVELFPTAVMGLFGVREINDPEGICLLRLMTPIIVVTSFASFVTTNYYTVGKYRSYIVFKTFYYLEPIVLLFVFTLLDSGLLAWSFLVSMVVCVAISFLIMYDLDTRIKKLIADNVSVDLSIPYDFSAIEPAMTSIRSFLLTHGAEKESANSIEHCVDELLYNIIKHAPKRLTGKSLELRSVLVNNEIIVTFKYDGKPFNPIISFEDKAVDAVANHSKLQLSLRVFNHYAIKPFYHYGYGVNFLSMTI